MEVVLCRVDSRLIHGQVVTKWVNQSNANRIIVVSEELEQDEFMRSVYLMAAPPEVKVDCLGIESMKKAKESGDLDKGKILLILPDLKKLKELVDAGLYKGEVQVGGLGGGPNRKVVFQNITLDQADVDILQNLSDDGISVYFQTIPEDTPQKLDKIISKYGKE
ncbi:PTS system mannose/fructose/N-acetylgalactosamine-transporter subunit IIB [Companilactobacillus jidongensis]|uniref:PTS system mannose/fructose/N-acetylgalactosamine-transporter subunit IIB n=1 Tax=Companilactobacillus jidongensis TaxID=2486006 RepID=UPI000F774D42|nr:PTS sugar transporter subunit IIB [Companilactobacillus jidongensis]